MLPYLIALTGAYLIGNATKTDKFAAGGKVGGMRKAILIDVHNQEVKEIEVGNTLQDIYDQLKCSLFEIVSLPSGDDLYLDEEGLYAKNKKYFHYRGASYPFIGNGLILGVNLSTAESKSTTMTADEVRANVKFLNQADINPQLN